MARALSTIFNTGAQVPPAWAADHGSYPAGYIVLHESDWWRCRVTHASSAETEPGTDAEIWEVAVDLLPPSSAAKSTLVGDGAGGWREGVDNEQQVKSLSAEDVTASDTAGASTFTGRQLDIQNEEQTRGLVATPEGGVSFSDTETGGAVTFDDTGLTVSSATASGKVTADHVAGIVAGAPTATDYPLRVSLVHHSTSFSASDILRAKTVSVAADRRTLYVPDMAGVMIDGKVHYRATALPDVNDTANWDDAAGAIPANRAGKDIYLYLGKAALGNQLDLIYSLNSTAPTGYTVANSRKYGCFHCLAVNVGTISGHDLTGYLVGDIVSTSVKCLKHRPDSVGFGEGMAELVRFSNGQGAPGWWGDIYLPSGTGSNTASVYGGTISDTRDWNSFVDDFAAVGKELFSDWLFQVAAAGSNEATNITGSADPVTTGGHVDTAGRRMISHMGLEDCCGVTWQWLQDQSYRFDNPTAHGHTENTAASYTQNATTANTATDISPAWAFYDPATNKGKMWRQGGGGDIKLVAGGAYYESTACGSRSRALNNNRHITNAIYSARGCARSRVYM